MAYEGDQCIDAGSEYCPCYLAEMNQCITCSRLKGKTDCSCHWRGVCIYQDFHFLNYKKKDVRTYQEAEILEREKQGESLLIFTLKTSHTLARQLKQPGSYIFIRNRELEHYFDIPISIMAVDELQNQIKIAVEIHGIKTKSIATVSDKLLIRGPYWNGLFGLEHLKQAKEKQCLMILRGIAQAPAALATKYLLRAKNQIDLIIDQGMGKVQLFSEDSRWNILESDCNLYSPDVIKRLRKHLALGDYQLVLLGGSDYLQATLSPVFEEFKGLQVVRTNNQEICCGEGICGACIVYDASGIPIRSCKTQITESK